MDRIFARQWLSVLAMCTSSCSLVSQPPDFGDPDARVWLGDSAPVPPNCLPARTGEVVFNEVLAKPAGVDLDGDGLSISRDEAIELIYAGSQPGHLQGATLWLGDKQRGLISDGACLQPGQLVVLTGSKTGPVVVQPQARHIWLGHPLELRDSGATLRLQGVLGTDLGELTYPQAMPSQSWVRQTDGDAAAALVGHPPYSGGQHSIGWRLPAPSGATAGN